MEFDLNRIFYWMCSSVYHHTHIITSQLFLSACGSLYGQRSYFILSLYRCKTTRLLLNDICETNSWHLFLKLNTRPRCERLNNFLFKLFNIFSPILRRADGMLSYMRETYSSNGKKRLNPRKRIRLRKKNPIRFSYDSDIVQYINFLTCEYVDWILILGLLSPRFSLLKKKKNYSVDWIKCDERWIF